MVCAVVGVVTEIALSQFLMAQKDSQLAAAQGRVFPNGEFDHGPYGNGNGNQRQRQFGDRRPRQRHDFRGFDPGWRCRRHHRKRQHGIDAAVHTSVRQHRHRHDHVRDHRRHRRDRHRDRGGSGSGGSGGPHPPGFLFRGVQSVGTLGAVIRDGAVVNAGILAGETTCTAVDATAASALLDVVVGQSPSTVTIPGQGDFRVVAEQLPSGDIAVIGLPLDELHGTLVRLALIMIAVSAAGLLAAGLIVFFMVRRSLRPLERVAATARKVSTLPLDRGEVDLGVRVPASDTDPRTEIGQVGSALNQMLGHVSRALESRQAVRSGSGSSSRTPRTNCAPRWPPSAAMPNWPAAGSPIHPTVSHALGRVESESARMIDARRRPAALRPARLRPAVGLAKRSI